MWFVWVWLDISYKTTKKLLLIKLKTQIKYNNGNEKKWAYR